MERWKTNKLGELCHFIRGPFGGSLKKSIFKSDGYAVYEQQHAINNQFDNIRYFVDETKFEEMRRFELLPGDLIMSCSGTMGKVAIAPDKIKQGIINQALLKLTPSDRLDVRFLERYMQSPLFQEQLGKRTKGVAVKNVASVKVLKEIDVLSPPLPEQQRIVAILDEAFAGIDAAIANTRANLASAREMFESYLETVFYDLSERCPEFTLKQISQDFGRGKSKHRPRNDPKLYGGPYPFIQTGDVRNCDHVIQQSTQTYSEAGLAQSKLWPKGTICITIAANIAETGILGFDACFPDSVIGIVIDPSKTTNEYVEYLLQSVKARIKAKGKGSAQDNINLATFENEYFPFPTSLDEQTAIVEKLNTLSRSIQNLETIYQQKLDALVELKQSILQKAFSGELTREDVAA